MKYHLENIPPYGQKKNTTFFFFWYNPSLNNTKVVINHQKIVVGSLGSKMGQPNRRVRGTGDQQDQVLASWRKEFNTRDRILQQEAKFYIEVKCTSERHSNESQARFQCPEWV